MIKGPRIFWVIFLSSFCGLAYELTLIRIFSISLWYHFAFMIISIAMLGIGASGTILSLYPRLRNLSHIAMYTFLLGVSIPLSYVLSNQIPFDPVRLSWERTQLLYIGLYYITLSLPFFCIGLIVATAFASLSEKSGLVYGADLLGAGMGSMGILYVMTIMSPDKVVFILALIALSASLIVSKNWLRAISLVLILTALSFFFFQPSVTKLRMSLYKGLQLALKYPGAGHIKTYLGPFSRIDTFRSPAVRFAPGLSLRYLHPLPEQIGFAIDGGDINAITASGDPKPLAFLKYLPSFLPYEIGQKDDVLILDPKGGLQVLVAQMAGAKNVSKIESNPLLVEIIRKDYKEFSGNIFGDNTYSGLGRSWLKTGKRKFDIIDISLMGTMPSASFGISEDYRFTIEAFKEYIGHLKPDGILSINLFILPPPRIELRLLNTIIASMEEMGIKKTAKYIVVIRTWGSICILVKKSPFTLNELNAIKKFSRDRRFDLIHYPGIKEEESNIYVRMPSNEYFTAFKNVLNPETREKLVNDYLFDIRPVHDDDPFFHYYLRLKNIGAIYRIMGEKWQYFIEEGYILPAVFIQVLFLSLILVMLPAVAKRKVDKKGSLKLRLNPILAYFAFLGIGFMFVEISLIQKTILPLENPSYAVATVLTSILVSSGIGSLFSQRVIGLTGFVATPAISFLAIIYSFFLPAASDFLSLHSMPVKIILVFLILMPLGFFMGIPFPSGLKILGRIDNSLIPWAWAINGCLSVLAPIMTIMLAMAIGFKGVFWLGALAYLMAFTTLTLFSSAPHRSSAQRLPE